MDLCLLVEGFLFYMVLQIEFIPPDLRLFFANEKHKIGLAKK
jgi:hypothetical protein